MRVVSAERWFGGGKCLVRDVRTQDTHLAARLIPGEVAAVEQVGDGWSAQWVATDILAPSPARVVSECQHFAEGCSGCSLLHIAFGDEKRYKQQLIAEVLERFADLTFDAEKVFWLGPERRFGDRTRTSLSISAVEASWVMGWRRLGGEPLRVDECLVLHPRLLALLPALQRALLSVPVVTGEKCQVHLWMSDPGPTQDQRADDRVATPLQLFAATDANAELGQALTTALVQCGAQVVASHGLPWGQTAPSRAQFLYDWLQRQVVVPGERVLDATCGTGAMTRIFAREAASVMAVDASWPAIVAAKSHPSQQELNERVEFRGGLIATVLPRLVTAGKRFDTILFNPMRETLGEITMRAAAETGAHRIVYVAPAPRAGAEDIGTLRRLGYEVEQVGAADVHPGTANVLMVVVMRRPPPNLC